MYILNFYKFYRWQEWEDRACHQGGDGRGRDRGLGAGRGGRRGVRQLTAGGDVRRRSRRPRRL